MCTTAYITLDKAAPDAADLRDALDRGFAAGKPFRVYVTPMALLSYPPGESPALQHLTNIPPKWTVRATEHGIATVLDCYPTPDPSPAMTAVEP